MFMRAALEHSCSLTVTASDSYFDALLNTFPLAKQQIIYQIVALDELFRMRPSATQSVELAMRGRAAT